MITALQNFISRKGKPVFLFLLIVVCVSFVLYLSQGTSIFDFMPDPNREKKEFYGTDLNDPEQRRVLSVTNKVASDLGAIISPTREVLEAADVRYFENLQAQLRAAYQPENRDKIDQEAMQSMFGYMQSWRNFPDAVKVMAIARSGDYDYEFSESSIRAKLIMDSLAEDFGFLPLVLNDPAINSLYHNFINQMNPMLADDENRSNAFQNLARFRGVAPRDVDAILYEHYRAHQIDRIFTNSGYSLDLEGEIELHRDQFAWDAEAISLSSDDFDFNEPSLFSVMLEAQPTPGEHVTIDLGGYKATFEFTASSKEANGSKYFVSIGKDKSASLKALSLVMASSPLGVKGSISGNTLSLMSEGSTLSSKIPSFQTSSSTIKVVFVLRDELESFHEEVKMDAKFVQPARTYATVVSFESGDFYTSLTEPDEARMRSYFERNKMLFEPLPPVPSTDSIKEDTGAKGPTGEKGKESETNSSQIEQVDLSTLETNSEEQTKPKVVSFEEVREEVMKRIMEGDKIDAERESAELTQQAALDFLDSVNSIGEKARSGFPNYQEFRNSKELEELIKTSGAKLKKISFAKRDMAIQSRVLGLETRENERRANRDPLVEVDALNNKLFFTRSIRKSKDGYVVFILDRKTEEEPSQFKDVEFSTLYAEFVKKQRANAFGKWIDQEFVKLTQGNFEFGEAQTLNLNAKSSQAVRASYDAKSSKIRNQLRELQDERTKISSAERESNATAQQKQRKVVLDQEIEDLRESQAAVNRERLLANQLLDVVNTLEPDGVWVEQERTGESVLFVRLNGVYTLRAKKAEPELITGRVRDLEYSRSENVRSLLVDDLIAAGLNP